MRRFEYVCRCGKRFESLFQQKRHAKYWCLEKHLHREQFKTLIDFSKERPQKLGRNANENSG